MKYLFIPDRIFALLRQPLFAKTIISFVFAVIATTATNCSKSSDSTPTGLSLTPAGYKPSCLIDSIYSLSGSAFKNGNNFFYDANNHLQKIKSYDQSFPSQWTISKNNPLTVTYSKSSYQPDNGTDVYSYSYNNSGFPILITIKERNGGGSFSGVISYSNCK